MSLITLVVMINLIGLAILLRIIPLFLSPAGAGVDHWFWRKYIETFRQKREFPPNIPQYLLDQHQWYPPLFPLVMTLISPKLFERWNHLMAIGVDLIRLILLLLIAAWFTQNDLLAIMLAGLIYATTPIQISYNFQLNPRGLGALFLDSLLILLLWFYSYHGPWWTWLFVIGLSGLILLTHKMTTQLFWFICVCSSVIFKDLRILLLIPISIVTAIILSKGFYFKVLIAHWDIVKFWKEHWRWIGADAVRESPIYGETNYQRSAKLHQTGIKGFIWYCFILFGFNPASWVACLLIFERLFIAPHVLIYSTWLIVWLLVPCLLSALTTFVPYLRCIGAGYLYLYNTSFITSFLLAIAYRYTKSPGISFSIYSAALILNVVGVMLFYKKFLNNNRSRIDEGFNTIIHRLKELPTGTVWCIPSSWHEPVAYKTQHPVLWGAHGFGFKHLTPTFPRILLPLKKIIEKYDVHYLLTMEGHLNNRFLEDMPKNIKVIKEANYLLYVFE